MGILFWLKSLQWRTLLLRGFSILVLVTGVVSAIWIHGYKTAETRLAAQYTKELRERQNEIQELDQEVFTLSQAMDWERKERNLAAEELDNAARENLDFARPGIGLDGLRTISDHWNSRK